MKCLLNIKWVTEQQKC